MTLTTLESPLTSHDRRTVVPWGTRDFGESSVLHASRKSPKFTPFARQLKCIELPTRESFCNWVGCVNMEKLIGSIAMVGILLACVVGVGKGALAMDKLVKQTDMLTGHVAEGPVKVNSIVTTPNCSHGVYAIPTCSGIAKVEPYINAVTECAEAGAVVAGANTGNFAELSALIVSCNPPVNGSWIASWNGDTYNGTHMFMYPKWPGDDGYVVLADLLEDHKFPVICEVSGPATKLSRP